MTKNASEHMRRMQQQMQDMHQQQPQPQKNADRHVDGEYIDYEEVR